MPDQVVHTPPSSPPPSSPWAPIGSNNMVDEDSKDARRAIQ